MKCPRCHHESVGDFPFCTHCGKDLMPKLDCCSIKDYCKRFGPLAAALLLFFLGLSALIREIYYLR